MCSTLARFHGEEPRGGGSLGVGASLAIHREKRSEDTIVTELSHIPLSCVGLCLDRFVLHIHPESNVYSHCIE